jgi:Mn2+/Fe2+ NRAMP family transporter
MRARLGKLTGIGLAGVMQVRYPRWILWRTGKLLVIANFVNIGADLRGMAPIMEPATGVNSPYWTPAFALLTVCQVFCASFLSTGRIFKWLNVVLFAYTVPAFPAHLD